MLQIKNITKKYSSDTFEQIALDNVSMNFRHSEFVSILGQSGSGKTTLLNIIGGLDKYTSGDLIINGVSTRKFIDRDWDIYRNHNIGFVFQSYNLIGHQSVLSNVEMALTLSGVKKAERKKRAIEALEQVGLSNHIHKRPNQLSGGQMQRVAIARALVNEPDIILADEPTGALDSDTSVQIMDILKNIARDKLVIMVTHNPELAEEYSTRIIRVKDGHIVGDTNPYSDAEYSRDNSIAMTPSASYDFQIAQRLNPLSEFRLSGRKIANGVSPETLQAMAQKMQQQPKQNMKAPPQKTSMNFLTALSLSLNNLMTKKGRTLLTAVAGSIGIIGIALILAISTGVNNYIDEMQTDALASYPIQIQKETADMMGLMKDMMSDMTTTEDKSGRNEVHGNSMLFDSLKSTSMGEQKVNNLKDFKKYLDEHQEDLDKHTLAIQYGYDIDLNIFVKDSKDKYLKADLKELMSEAMGGDGSNAASTTTLLNSMGGLIVWEELLTDPTTGEISNLVTDQYDLVYGKWPTEANELVLVMNGGNEIADIALYALGLMDKDVIVASTVAALSGQKENKAYTEVLQKTWSYQDICNIPLKMVLPTDYYQYDKTLGLWVDISDNSVVFNSIIDKGFELKIAGIVKPNPEAENLPLNGYICYTNKLTSYYLDNVNNSEMIKQQLLPENSNKNLITGLPFVVKEKPKALSDSEKVKAFKEYIADLTDGEKESLYYNILAKPGDKVIQDAVDESVSKYKDMTVEEIVNSLKKDYSEQMGYSPEVVENMFKNYTKDELLDLLKKTNKDMIINSYKMTADETISNIKNTPSDEELENLKKEITDELFAGLDELPTSEQEATKYSIKLSYIMQSWSMTPGLSEDALMSYLYTLSMTEVNEIFDNMLTEQAIQMYRGYRNTSTAAENAKKVADAFDEYINTCTDENIIHYYDNNMLDIVSDLKFEELLDEMGYATLDNPAFINIYPKDFNGKTKITDMIEDYNNKVEEKDKILYTDMMAELMSSVSTIVGAISAVLICFVAISLVVSSIMIGIITYISVLERTKEIGILRAVGASKSDISRVFNAETFIVGLLAGLVGIGATLVMCIPINIVARALSGIDTFTATLPLTGYLLIVLSIGLTLVAGIFPAMMAAKKDPVLALRSE